MTESHSGFSGWSISWVGFGCVDYCGAGHNGLASGAIKVEPMEQLANRKTTLRLRCLRLLLALLCILPPLSSLACAEAAADQQQLLKECQGGNNDSCNKLGALLYPVRSKACEAGDAGSCYNVGTFYKFGMDVAKDESKMVV